MIIITGGAGFIGSALLWKFNQNSYDDILVVDSLGTKEKWHNLKKRRFLSFVHKKDFFSWLESENPSVEMIFHIGACSCTTEEDADYLMENNFLYSQKVFKYCTQHNIPLIYASSAATYGSGNLGYSDDLTQVTKLEPINKYGFSKQIFDYWVLKQTHCPPLWVGLKFFNVYGPQEYHKGSQASVVYHAFNQIKQNGEVKLFKSYKKEYAHGEQKRDFIYVKDVVDLMFYIFKNYTRIKSGIYNVGTGKARTFLDLAKSVFKAMNIAKPKIKWIPMPKNIKDQYQYFTEADLNNLKKFVCPTYKAVSLEEGILDYVQNYLMQDDKYL